MLGRECSSAGVPLTEQLTKSTLNAFIRRIGQVLRSAERSITLQLNLATAVAATQDFSVQVPKSYLRIRDTGVRAWPV